MKKFECEVTKTYNYVIEIDETVWTDAEIKEWSKSFYEANDLQDVVMILAEMMTSHEAGDFIEGFGVPKINGGVPFVWGDPDRKTVSKDININILEKYCDVDCEEI